MAILNNNPLVGASGNQGGYNINNSLRFRSSASAYLSRTPAGAGSRTIWTWSGWVKRGTLGSSAQALLGAGTSNTVYDRISFESDSIRIVLNNGTGDINTTAVFRDPSAWYHVVVAFDTTQATASNRVKIYVNGTQITTFATATYPSQNYTTNINNNVITTVGALYVGSYGTYFDGYMAETYFIDGSQKAASDFGETDTTTGVWKPKAYTGTYGTNGFYLKFSDIATTSGSNAGLGKDFSGNTNYWTTNNISVTSGTTYDAMTDSPTNTSATVANYCVASSLNYRTSAPAPQITDANLTWKQSSTTASSIGTATFGVTSGKWYFEATLIVSGGGANFIGWVNGALSNTTANDLGYYSNEYSIRTTNGNKYNNNTFTAYGSAIANGDVIGLALDLDTGTMTFYKNNTSFGTAFSSLPSGTWFPAFDAYNSNGFYLNFGQRPFSYTPPTGYVALNTYNLPTPTILQGNKYMDATLYSGTGAAQVIVNQGQFKPDLVWIKSRNNITNNNLTDSVRGVTKIAFSNSTNAEATASVGLTSFDNNGFSLATGGDVGFSASGYTYVGWQWQAGQGSTSSNTSGSITSTVSVNTTAGFSIVTYTGTGSTKTFGHGLGVTPAMFIVKSRSQTGENWVTWHKSFSNTAQGNMALNTTDAVSNSASVWGNTAPTSTLITVGNAAVNNNTSTYVCYAWAEIAGFSKFGSYTGNGSTDGTFIFTGFRPKFVVWKRTDISEVWNITDTSINPYNAVDKRLYVQSSVAELTGQIRLDILSNGFKARTTDADTNGSGGTYIYMAFAENPFKNSLAR